MTTSAQTLLSRFCRNDILCSTGRAVSQLAAMIRAHRRMSANRVEKGTILMNLQELLFNSMQDLLPPCTGFFGRRPCRLLLK